MKLPKDHRIDAFSPHPALFEIVPPQPTLEVVLERVVWIRPPDRIEDLPYLDLQTGVEGDELVFGRSAEIERVEIE